MKEWTPERREAQRQRMLGTKCSDITKQRMSNSRKGVKHPMYGKKHSQETKKKMSEAKIGFIPWNKGIKWITNSGSNHWHWNNNREEIIGRHNRKLHDSDYKQWVMSVRNRDGWKCKIANGDCSGRLETHHILGWKSHPELRYKINNGITLCHLHHPKKRIDESKLTPYFQSLVGEV